MAAETSTGRRRGEGWGVCQGKGRGAGGRLRLSSPAAAGWRPPRATPAPCAALRCRVSLKVSSPRRLVPPGKVTVLLHASAHFVAVSPSSGPRGARPPSSKASRSPAPRPGAGEADRLVQTEARLDRWVRALWATQGLDRVSAKPSPPASLAASTQVHSEEEKIKKE